MIMKRFLREASTLLRTVLLFGVLSFLNTQAQAQTIPDAFETMDPATIIGDNNWYYIEFYDDTFRSYMTDCGVNRKVLTKDFLPSDNRLWTLESAGDNQFKLKSKEGHYIQFAGGFEGTAGGRLGCINGSENATSFTFLKYGEDYVLLDANEPEKILYRANLDQWSEFAKNGNNSNNRRSAYMRFAKLKSNTAYIIYYREEGVNNTTPNAETTRHYLTYSGTAESSLGTNWWQSDVSSRKSIIPKNMPLCTLPTVAAYHKDGLWTLEKGASDGQFYIKKYGADQYLNEDEHWTNVYGSELGNKDASKGVYTLEDPLANRYTLVQNASTAPQSLTSSMFNNYVDFNVGNGASLGADATVVGTSTVEYGTYADLSPYRKMIINGTAGMQLRVLLSRQMDNYGPMVEKKVTIGSNGKAEVNLTNLKINYDPFNRLQSATGNATVSMTYVNGSNDALNTSYGLVSEAIGGYNKITGTEVGLGQKSWGKNNIIYLRVDASAYGTIKKATLKATATGSTDGARATTWGAGLVNDVWPDQLTWNTATELGLRNITDLTPTGRASVPQNQTQEISLDITDAFTDDNDKKVTILVYELAAAGGNFSNPWVEVEYFTDDTSVSYAHLNTIKTTDSNPTTGTISSITLSNARYLHHAQGDGWQVMQWPDDGDPDHWYAGFYPVEVPNPNEDNIYQVVVKVGDQMLGSDATMKTYSSFNPDAWTLEQFGDNPDYKHFRLKNSAGQYYKSNGVLTENESEAHVFTNEELNTLYTLEWLPNTETRILHDVTHKVSNVKLYYDYNPTSAERQQVYSQQGLITNDLSEWQNSDGTQNVNEFKITHYVKKGETLEFGLPTTLRANNDHILYQRWYNYQNDRDLEGLKNHFSVSTSAGTVMDYLYNNGMVTGVRVEDLPDWLQPNAEGKMLDWPTVFPGAKTYVSHLFKYNNSDGQPFTLAADVSRYNDFRYWNSSSHLDGNLEEPSLTMRYIYYMKDAKEMATKLTDCTEGSDKWLEEKTFHFPAKRLAYETQKQAEYQGEFIGIKHNFKDYWVFDDPAYINYQSNGTLTDPDNHLVPADNTLGKIEVVIDDVVVVDTENPENNKGGTGITLGGHVENGVSQGYYLYDEGNKKGSITRLYGESRFIVFNYPGETVNNAGEDHKAYIKVYFNNGGTRYQLALFEIIFDENTSTLPWTDTDETKRVQGSYRDPNNLLKKAGDPIAKITFDYPKGATFKNSSEIALHNLGYMYGYWAPIDNSSPVPLTFGKTNYGFDGDNPSWGSYALVKTMSTRHGNSKTAMPVNYDASYGYSLPADEGMESAFLYIDASEQPGDICSIPFYGEFCAGDRLMCSGWISGSNKINDTSEYRCPGSVILTVKGKNTGQDDETIYRFCPGQCYELDQGDYVNWQQFYFEFKITNKYEQYWVEVNNNCVSSQGGDFMLDNIEVYALVPEATPEMNSPICINKEASEMQLLKVSLGFEKILSALGATEVTGDANGVDKTYSFVFLEKGLFLTTFQKELSTRYGVNKTIADLERIIKTGEYGEKAVIDYLDAYKAAFNAAVMGDPTKMWDSNDRNNDDTKDAAVLNFHWNTNYSKMETYSFAKAVNKLGAVFTEIDPETDERLIVMNGNYSNQKQWNIYTDYYIVPYDVGVTTLSGNALYEDFNVWSMCNKKKVFQIKPPLEILSLESSDETRDLVVCEGKIPTLLTNLTGYDTEGNEAPLTDLNYDWWLGDPANGVPATLENYHLQENSARTARLDESISALRTYYKDITSLDGITTKTNLTQDMIDFLQELVDKGQLVLHQKSVNVPAVRTEDDPYFYVVACPIHDEKFDQALNYEHNKYVAYFCDEPQGLRMKLGEKAPTLKCGFVKGENGYDEGEYEYPADNPVLSIRLAKKAQFMEVRHGAKTDEPGTDYNTSAESSKHFLWLPIRNAEVETPGSTGVIRKSGDYNVYLASTDDKERDEEIYEAMSQNVPSLPIVGKIVQLTAVDTKGKTNVNQTSNRLCIYFIEDFDVREGYSYTLSLPFREEGDVNTCDGTLLINMKIVPDYEVWTGAAGNTDWNNDQNWRRADGDKTNNKDELYVDNGTSLKGNYVTNAENYYKGKDRVFLKGFAPLYCTHVLMMKNEWGNAPVLYDALDGASGYSAKPFPNLRDKDNWDNNSAAATATPILKFDMQARLYDIWTETYESGPGKGRSGDLIAEMYQINTCDEIAFQPGTELRNAHLLNYNSAWVEYELENKRWYLLGSPLQGTISGEWYAPTGTAKQNTTYYEDVKFNSSKYDRYSPAIYQRSWDKAKAVLYEVGAIYSTDDDNQGANLGNDDEGIWSGTGNPATWSVEGSGTADQYLDRLGYKPMGGKKANVAIKGLWSNTYNDAQVDYANGGFSVMVMNHLKGNDTSDGSSVIRLPKEDTEYEYWDYGKSEHGTNTYLVDDPNDEEDNNTVQKIKNRAKNRGRLKTDLLLPASTNKTETAASKYGDKRIFTRIPIKQSSLSTMLSNIGSHEEIVPAGISSLGYYLVENPFPCGLNMNAFFANTENQDLLEAKYWILTKGDGQNPRQQLVQKAGDEWITDEGSGFTTANNVLAPGQGFFVEATTANADDLTITFTEDMQAQSRFGVMDDGEEIRIEVGVKQDMKEVTETITMDDGSTQIISYEVPDYESDGVTLKTSPIYDYVKVYSYAQTTNDDLKYKLKDRTRSEEANLAGLVITAERDGNQTSALVMQCEQASNDFLPTEDTETFITSDFENVPTVYTLCGRLATAINSIHDFRSLPIGVESNNDAPCVLTFQGVEMLGDSISFYDAVEQTLIPLKSGMQVSVSGQTQNRYYLVRSLIKEEAAEETHLQIFTEGLTAKVIASTAEPILNVRCFDTAGRLIHKASPQTVDYSFSLPRAGIYIIEAETESDHKTKKVMAK